MNNVTQSLIVVVACVLVAGSVAGAGGQASVEAFGMPLTVSCAALAFAINWIAFVPAYLARTERYYDLIGSLTYLSVTALAVSFANPGPRGWMLTGMIAVWAFRLGSFLFLRIHRAGSDRRFDEVKQDFWQFLMAWTLQAVWVFLTLACALTAIATLESRSLDAWAAVGALVWGIGFGIEVVADRQKSAFRADPENAGRFITSGLWAWSRHPNYFGEFVLWVGVALIAFPVLSGWQHVTLISPLFVFILLTRISGIPPLELRAEEKWGEDPEYRAFADRTPVFWLRPPRST